MRRMSYCPITTKKTPAFSTKKIPINKNTVVLRIIIAEATMFSLATERYLSFSEWNKGPMKRLKNPTLSTRSKKRQDNGPKAIRLTAQTSKSVPST